MPLAYLRNLLTRKGLSVVWHPDYRHGIPGAPIDPLRAERVLAFLLDAGLVRRRGIARPRAASVESLLRAHTAEYLRSLDRPEVVGEILGAPLAAGEARRAVELQRLHCGGTTQAARLALRGGGVVAHLGGGFHHASPDRGAGFCLFNDSAVAIQRLRAAGFRGRVLVVDLDIHDGNGTRAAFARDASVHTFSIHNADWDAAAAIASTSVALGSGVDDGVFLGALRERLPSVVREHEPELVIYVAGADPAAGDAIGDWRLTPDGMLERDRFVAGLAAAVGAPMAVLLGGGYGEGAWRPAARFFGWIAAGRVVEPPDDLQIALHRFREVERAIGDSTPQADVFDWTLSEEDLTGVAPVSSLLLGRWTQDEVRHLLERFGLLEQLRARGFPEPVVEIEPSSGLGETVRIWGGPDQRALLVELRARREANALPGFELLWVEWLLLQNPRGSFPPHRPPLPGQEHPGLGIFNDVVGLLALLCQEVGLDGIGFRSAHYHIVALGYPRLGFLDPEDERRFQAVREGVQHLSLARASAAVAAGDAGEWREVAMVLPVSARLLSRMA
jgi:acetoin utilization deacetylase AcuC-like enzyme